MSEKRFKKMDTIIDPFPIWDTVEEKGYNCTDTLDLLVDLLNEQDKEIGLLRLELETHKHPLWSTREAEMKVNKLADSLADEVKKNGVLNEEINQLRIENMRLKKGGDEMSERNCGHCKHFQIDGMFGLWCEKDHDWTLVNGNCSDFESEKRFVCIDVGYGDDWYITDNGKRLSEMEIVDLLNKMSDEIEEVEISIKLFEDDVQIKDKKIGEQQATISALKEENEQLRQKLDFYLLDEFEWKEKYGDILDE